MKLIFAAILRIWVVSGLNAVLCPLSFVVAVAGLTEELPVDGSDGQTQSEAAETGPHL